MNFSGWAALKLAFVFPFYFHCFSSCIPKGLLIVSLHHTVGSLWVRASISACPICLSIVRVPERGLNEMQQTRYRNPTTATGSPPLYLCNQYFGCLTVTERRTITPTLRCVVVGPCAMRFAIVNKKYKCLPKAQCIGSHTTRCRHKLATLIMGGWAAGRQCNFCTDDEAHQ